MCIFGYQRQNVGLETVTLNPVDKPTIQSILIIGVGTDNILSALGQCCPNLQCLKASYSPQITDLGLRALYGMSKVITEEFTSSQQNSPKNKRM